MLSIGTTLEIGYCETLVNINTCTVKQCIVNFPVKYQLEHLLANS